MRSQNYRVSRVHPGSLPVKASARSDRGHRPLAAPHRRFPLEAIAEAHRYLEVGGQVGKIVISVTSAAGTSS
ncbi:zinc-binding dehydrogenase [Streptomyces avermitilis]|uniref:zinc-binding dehydrogenase n=1 Tax=Streptomyces avermitilis TaxID=33903 RepID=UPI0036CD0FEA